jgi:hypothetical protein
METTRKKNSSQTTKGEGTKERHQDGAKTKAKEEKKKRTRRMREGESWP